MAARSAPPKRFCPMGQKLRVFAFSLFVYARPIKQMVLVSWDVSPTGLRERGTNEQNHKPSVLVVLHDSFPSCPIGCNLWGYSFVIWREI